MGIHEIVNLCSFKGLSDSVALQGRIQDFMLGGAHLNKLRRVEGGAKIVGVFRVKNHDFTPKNHIFPNCGGTTCDLSFHRHVILYIHAFIKKINFNLLLRCSNN
jgi:hypothetical protein